MRTLAPAFMLDRHQGVEQPSRAQRRVADRRRVEKRRLRSNDADRLRFVIAGDFQMSEERPEPGDREIEVCAPIADVAAEGDRHNDVIQLLDYPITRLEDYSIHREGSTSP